MPSNTWLFSTWQTFPSSSQWPIDFKQHLIDQNFPTIKQCELFFFLKKENSGYSQSLVYFPPQSFMVTISVLFGESTGRVGDPGIPERVMLHPACISVMFVSSDCLSEATRRGKSPCCPWTVTCGYPLLLLPLWPCASWLNSPSLGFSLPIYLARP